MNRTLQNLMGLVAALGCFSLAHASTTSSTTSNEVIQNVERAIHEQRFLDAGRLLDEVLLSGARDPRLAVLSGELNLARGRPGPALDSYRLAATVPETKTVALEGEGLALSQLGRSDEALVILREAVAANPAAWRAWNALGREYDARSRWDEASTAYAHAFESSDGAAIVLNNRGYSQLLQHRRAEAITDLVAALAKKPDLVEARANLRLALAMDGDYERAIAGGADSDQAVLLNNAGFAAAARGDYAKATELLQRAQQAKGEYYPRASENLKVVRALAAGTPPANVHR
jgi:Flp pilus assembly protein TadD